MGGGDRGLTLQWPSTTVLGPCRVLLGDATAGRGVTHLRLAAACVPDDKHRVAHLQQLLQLHDLQHEAVFCLQLELRDALLDDLGAHTGWGAGQGAQGPMVFLDGGASRLAGELVGQQWPSRTDVITRPAINATETAMGLPKAPRFLLRRPALSEDWPGLGRQLVASGFSS